MLVGSSFWQQRESSYSAFILAWIALVPLWSTENVFSTYLKFCALFWSLIICCLDTDCSKYWKNIWKEPYQSYFKPTGIWIPREKHKIWKLKIWVIDFFIANLTMFLWANEVGYLKVIFYYWIHPMNIFILLLLFSSSVMLKSAMWKKKGLKPISVSIFENNILVIVFPCVILVNKYTF